MPELERRDWFFIGHSVTAWCLQGSTFFGNPAEEYQIGAVIQAADNIETDGGRVIGAGTNYVPTDSIFFHSNPGTPAYANYLGSLPVGETVTFWADHAPVGALGFYDDDGSADATRCWGRQTNNDTRGRGLAGFSVRGLFADAMQQAGGLSAQDMAPALVDNENFDPTADMHFFAGDGGQISDWNVDGATTWTLLRTTGGGYNAEVTPPDRVVWSYGAVNEDGDPSSMEPSAAVGIWGPTTQDAYPTASRNWLGCQYYDGETDPQTRSHTHSLAEALNDDSVKTKKTVIFGLGENDVLEWMKLHENTENDDYVPRIIPCRTHMLDDVPDDGSGDYEINYDGTVYRLDYEGQTAMRNQGIADFVDYMGPKLKNIIDTIYGYATYNNSITEDDVEVFFMLIPGMSFDDDRGGDGSYDPRLETFELPRVLECTYDSKYDRNATHGASSYTIDFRDIYNDDVASPRGRYNPTADVVEDGSANASEPFGVGSGSISDTDGPFNITSIVAGLGDGHPQRSRTGFGGMGYIGIAAGSGHRWLAALAYRRWRACFYADIGREAADPSVTHFPTNQSSHTTGSESANWEATYDDHMAETNYYGISGDDDHLIYVSAFTELNFAYAMLNQQDLNEAMQTAMGQMYRYVMEQLPTRNLHFLGDPQRAVEYGTGTPLGRGARETLNQRHTMDGVHPNYYGAKAWLESLAPQIVETTSFATTGRTSLVRTGAVPGWGDDNFGEDPWGE